MTTKTFTVPNISCGHCTHTIQMELSDLAGVKSVAADEATKPAITKYTWPIASNLSATAFSCSRLRKKK